MTDADIIIALFAIAALGGVAFAVWPRKERPFNPNCRHCGRHAIFHGRIGSECPGLATHFESADK